MCFSGCKSFVSKELGEGAAEADQILRQPVLDDAAVAQHDGAISDEDRREPLAGDQDGASRDGRAAGWR